MQILEQENYTFYSLHLQTRKTTDAKRFVPSSNAHIMKYIQLFSLNS